MWLTAVRLWFTGLTPLDIIAIYESKKRVRPRQRIHGVDVESKQRVIGHCVIDHAMKITGVAHD